MELRKAYGFQQIDTPRQYLTPYKCVFKGVMRTITNTVARRVIEIPWGARV